MTPERIPPAETATVAELTHGEIQSAAERAQTIGDFRRGVQERADELLEETEQSPVAQETRMIEIMQGPIRREVGEALRERGEEFDEVAQEAGAVQMADLAPGVGGRVPEAGAAPAEAKVSRDLVHEPEEFVRAATHEADKEVGHASQVEPKSVREDVALIVEEQRVSVTAAIEGDVERGTAQKIDGSPAAVRPGQPEKDYAEGQRAANAAVGLVGESVWNGHLKKGREHSGDLAHLQQEIWTARLKTHRDAATVVRILEEGEETGYREEAREALAA